MTDRERFLAALFTAPPLRGDAIVCLCGDDAEARLQISLQLFKQGAAPFIVLSGGVSDPPRRRSAADLAPTLLGAGVGPDRILLEEESQHTADQAEAVIAIAVREEWKRLLLVASSYHLPRAFLTFVTFVPAPVRVIPIAAAQVPWWNAPPGQTINRMALLALEWEKIARYRECASYGDGLRYLERWESGG